MEYQKIINFLGNMNDQLSKFSTNNCVQLCYARGVCIANNQIKTVMLNLSLCDHSNA